MRSYPAVLLRACLLASALSMGSVAGVGAQVVPTPAEARPAPVAPPPLDISPGGAFLRALVVPGWGHAAIGAHGRGGFYLGAQSATVYTLLRARTRIGSAQDRVRLAESVVLARLANEGVTDPVLIETALDEDDDLNRVRNLLEARKEQQEDLVALSIFLVFLSAADAYVSAHLGRFPEPLDLSSGPTADGRLEVALKVGLGN